LELGSFGRDSTAETVRDTLLDDLVKAKHAKRVQFDHIHLCKAKIGGLMNVEAFHQRLLARSQAAARP
jgi:hypothetical protein